MDFDIDPRITTAPKVELHQHTDGSIPVEVTWNLMRHHGRVMSRTLITEYAWDYHFDPGTNIVDVVITRLRKKIDHGREPKLIHTVRGVGYVVRA